MKTKFKFEGGRELERALHELPKASTAKNVVRKVLRKRGKPIAEAMRARVPRDDDSLYESIAVSTKLSRSNRRERKKYGKDDIEVFVGPGPLPHAHLIEFGWEDGDAQPYVRPAWDQEKRGVLEGLADDFWEEIEKAAERARRKAAKGK